MSGALLIAVGGNTNTLIPLFAIGVFIGFTLSQTGLVVHWRRMRPPGWRRRAAINGLGAVVTAVATVVFLVSKFTEGAWVVVIAIPAFIFLFVRIHAYYERAGRGTGNRRDAAAPEAQAHHRDRPGQPDLAPDRARPLRGRVPRPGGGRRHRRAAEQRRGRARAETLQAQWRRWNPGVPLRVLHTEYASVVEPIVAFIDETGRTHPDQQLVVLIPVIRPDRWRYRFLHNQLDLVLSSALRSRSDIVVARISMPLGPLSAPSTPGHAAP